MIPHQLIKDLVGELGLREDIIEKDYVIGWLLWGIGGDPKLTTTWVFKGGTCLKKCYRETYRFSEDLDFTVLPNGPIKAADLSSILEPLLARIYEASGIDFTIKAPYFRDRPGGLATEGRIYYRGPRNAPMAGTVKLDLNADEKVARPSVLRKIAHPYPDSLPDPGTVRCYAFEEVFAEKLRAVGERCRPRDVYDVVHLFWDPSLQAAPDLIRNVLIEKCRTKAVPVPKMEDIGRSPFRAELESEWSNMLAHQLPTLPPFDHFWTELPKVFAWLEERVPKEALAPVRLGAEELPGWTPPPAVWTLGAGVPLESLRYAATNHLCVELVYRNEQGALNTRVIEPYSLRRTRLGHLLLHAVKVPTQKSRTYRIDRIQSIKVTTQPFTPKYQVEFSPSGPINAPPSAPKAHLGVFQGTRAPRPRTGRTRTHFGPTYIFECSSCGKRSSRSKHNTHFRPHKSKDGWDCSGRSGYLVDTRYS